VAEENFGGLRLELKFSCTQQRLNDTMVEVTWIAEDHVHSAVEHVQTVSGPKDHLDGVPLPTRLLVIEGRCDATGRVGCNLWRARFVDDHLFPFGFFLVRNGGF